MSRQCVGALIITIAGSYLLTSKPALSSVLVFDSLAIPAGGGSAFGGLIEVGLSISLQGTARNITQIDLYLGDNASEEFRVRFYDLNDVSGEPSTLLWESPTQLYPHDPPFFNRKTISVAVPAILVPDSMAWTVVPITPAPHLTVLTTVSPTVGAHISYWKRYLDSSWDPLVFSNGTFGARLIAIPEPTSVIPAFAAFVLIAARRRNTDE